MTVAFSPDGKILVTGGDEHTIKLWKANIGSVAVAVSPVAQLIASCSRGTIKLWELVQQQGS